MIVDCHAHLLPPWRMAKLIQWTRRFNPRLPVPVDVSLETLLAFFQAMDYVASPIGAGDGVGRMLGYHRLAALLQTSGREYWDVLFIPRERAELISPTAN